MPYIKQDRKNKLNDLLKFLSNDIQNVGELNFIITKLIQLELECLSNNYESLNSMIGVLECAKLELYRRIVVPYEDEKIKLNGDVY